MIGRMRERITFQELTIMPTPGGGSKEQWTDAFTLWTDAVPLENGRQLDANQVVLKDGYKFRVRWSKDRDINKERRIKFNAIIYTINSVIPWKPKGKNKTLKEYYEITAITSK